MSHLSMPAAGLLIQLSCVINSQSRQFLACVKPLNNRWYPERIQIPTTHRNTLLEQEALHITDMLADPLYKNA